MNAPDHLRGPMVRGSKVIGKRDEWVIARIMEGHRQTDIAEALGISSKAVGEIKVRHGVVRPQSVCLRSLFRLGLRVGNSGPAIEAMPRPARSALIDRAAKTGQTLANVLADFFAEHHGGQA